MGSLVCHKPAGRGTSHKYTNIKIYSVNTSKVLQKNNCQSSSHINN